MSKKLTGVITAALIVGAMGTTFAASNPFSDVPSGHWSYQAVTKLAQAGVIEGYGDGTFKGDKSITRYEMAQMVAKAMAKTNLNSADKSTIDQLAIEYKTELNNLGVRVADLESKVDNVKWGGKARLRLDQEDHNYHSVSKTDTSVSTSYSYLDLWATAKINDNWVAKAEFESEFKLKEDSGDTKQGNTSKVYVEGPLGQVKTKVGKFGALSKGGFVIDREVSGAQFKFGKVLETTLTTGRMYNLDRWGSGFSDKTFDYNGIEAKYKYDKNTTANIGYHNLKGEKFQSIFNNNADNLSIFEVGVLSKLNNDWTLDLNYFKANQDKISGIAVKDTGYFTQLTYKGADIKKEGSYDIFINYRQMPKVTQIRNTFGGYATDTKGWGIGFDYIPSKNIKWQTFYFDGKDLDTNATSGQKTKFLRTQVEMFF